MFDVIRARRELSVCELSHSTHGVTGVYNDVPVAALGLVLLSFNVDKVPDMDGEWQTPYLLISIKSCHGDFWHEWHVAVG